jgi:molecular chaperone DnaJ
LLILWPVLGVVPRATDAEIKKAYKRAALQFHPDKQADETLRGEAEVQFRLVTEANTVLSDARKRAAYDRGEDLDALDEEDGHGHGHGHGGHGGHGFGGFGGFGGHSASNDFFQQYARQQQRQGGAGGFNF